jgi:hypothetical protein
VKERERRGKGLRGERERREIGRRRERSRVFLKAREGELGRRNEPSLLGARACAWVSKAWARGIVRVGVEGVDVSTRVKTLVQLLDGLHT